MIYFGRNKSCRNELRFRNNFSADDRYFSDFYENNDILINFSSSIGFQKWEEWHQSIINMCENITLHRFSNDFIKMSKSKLLNMPVSESEVSIFFESASVFVTQHISCPCVSENYFLNKVRKLNFKVKVPSWNFQHASVVYRKTSDLELHEL